MSEDTLKLYREQIVKNVEKHANALREYRFTSAEHYMHLVELFTEKLAAAEAISAPTSEAE